MVGGVYFPLSPRDPENRLYMLLQQTQSRLVLVHWLTKTKFNDHHTLSDIDSALINNDSVSDIDIDRLSNVKVTVDDIAYIMFTSGSTGTPKGVSINTVQMICSKCYKGDNQISKIDFYCFLCVRNLMRFFVDCHLSLSCSNQNRNFFEMNYS